MPKRIGYLYEQVISEANCIQATYEMTKDKNHNKKAMRIRRNSEAYGRRIASELSEGRWAPRPYNEHIIVEGIRKKTRNIKVPCLHDQAVHHAILRVTIPHVMKRNYFYNTGSIPGAGQTRATRAMQRWMRRKKIFRYAGQFDIHHFYETCPHWAVMKALERIFKDKRFLALHRRILDSMGEGLAIGFYPAQWYANIVLIYVDNQIKQRLLPKCKYVRYMDDMVILHNNRRKLKRAREELDRILRTMGMRLKRNWKVFRIGSHGITFLSYRFFRGYTLLKKALLYRITRKIKKTSYQLNLHNAQSVMSYMGTLKHCNSYNYRKAHVYPKVSIKKCKGVISYESRKRRYACLVSG